MARKLEDILMKDDECLAMVASALRIGLYSQASLLTTKMTIEHQVDEYMRHLKAKEARNIIALCVFESSLPVEERSSVLQKVQKVTMGL